jgi:SAM-dependent methyltransferase
MNPVHIFNEFKRLSFGKGYWICHLYKCENNEAFFHAVVIPHYANNARFELFCDAEKIRYMPIKEAPGGLEYVARRAGVHDFGGFTVSFSVKLPKGDTGRTLSCRDIQSGDQIGCQYHVPSMSEFEKPLGAANRMRATRSDSLLYYNFTGYDDCVKIADIIKRSMPKSRSLRVLDWGVGSGRVTAHMRKDDVFEMFGTDIDPVNMKQLHANGFPASHFKLTEPGAEIPFDSASFDACFGISVFTHLTESLQFKYLSEIRRILKPGGIGIFSVHGFVHYFSQINDGNKFFDWIDKGIIVTGDNLDLSENFAKSNDEKLYVDTLHTPDYILKNWSRFFTSLSIIEAPTIYGQDFVVCRR